MLRWLFGSEDDSEVESPTPKSDGKVPWLYNSDGERDELGDAMAGSDYSDNSRQFLLSDGARGVVHRDGRVSADWKRADGSHSKYATDADSRDEAIDRLHQARKWWFGP